MPICLSKLGLRLLLAEASPGGFLPDDGEKKRHAHNKDKEGPSIMQENSSTAPRSTSAPSGTQSFERTMQARHLIMLSLGGVIGTGLFLNTGWVLSQAGAFGTILAYLAGAFTVSLVMMCLGELACAMPETGSFHVYAERFISPATGFLVVTSYWLTWTLALGTSLTGAGMTMQYWLPDVPVWVWCVFFALLILAMNVFTTRLFAESEFVFSIVKVVVIQVFVILGVLAVFGALPLKDGSSAPFFSNITANGFFPTGVMPILFTMVTVNFAYSGTELIGIAAGETKDPKKVIPRAIRTTVLRLVIFFVGTVFVLAALIPIDQAGVTKSPFVDVFERIGIPYTADLMNFVILTAILSAANSGLYASGRMAWSLAARGLLPAALKKQNARGLPVNAILFSMAGGVFALLTSVYAADTVFVVLTAISGLAVVIVWASICLAHFNFRRQMLREGRSLDDLAYRAPGYPWVPIVGFVLCIAACAGLAFDESQRIALYCGIPYVALCYAIYPIVAKRAKARKATAGAEAAQANQTSQSAETAPQAGS